MIVVTGISHHTASIDIRERVALTEETARQLAEHLTEQASVAEVFIVSTCNRLEIIAKSEGEGESAAENCAQVCRAALLKRAPEAEAAIYKKWGGDAVRHVFRVAASLDSLVVGEPQILGQLRQGFLAGKEAKTVGSHLQQLFVRAARSAKRIRTETDIGAGQVSVPSIAIELAKQIFGDLSGRKAVLIGSGEMGQTVARLLRDAGAELTVIARSKERGQPIAARMGAHFALMDAIPEVLKTADVVVSSTSAMSPVVRREHLALRRKVRRASNLFFIDLAVPRDIEPEVGELEGVFLYDVDDLAQVAAESTGSRKRAATAAETIIEESVQAWERRQSERAVVPTIKALRAKLRRGLEEELGRSLRGKLKDLDEEQRQALAKMLEAGLNRILHDPVTRLKQEVMSDEGLAADDLAGLLSELFDLQEVPEEELDVSSVRLPDPSSKVAYLPESREEQVAEVKHSEGGLTSTGTKWKNDAS